MSKSHAEILADIAKQVVEMHRAKGAQRYTTGQGQTTTDPEQGNVPVPHESWNYTLPEEYQG